MAGFVVPVAPGFMERLSSYDPTEALIARLSGENDDMAEQDDEQLPYERARLADLVQQLPLVEQDLMRLTSEGVRQADLAAIFGWTQANVSYRLKRAHERLKFIQAFPQPPEEKLRRDLAGILTEQQITVLWDLSLTSSQTNSAKRLGFSQGKVRHALDCANRVLSVRKERRLKVYLKMTSMLMNRKNMNMLVILPSCKGYQGRAVEYIGRLATPANDD